MKQFSKLNMVYLAAALIVLGVVFIPLAIEKYNLRTQGIHYFTNHMENYHNNAHPVDGEYTIEIDLNDLENNKGKVLYDDGENHIYVSKVVAHHSNEYELFFSSSGSYSLGGATLVSGVALEHKSDALLSEFQAQAKAAYSGNTYQLSPTEDSSDAEEFGFYLELPDDIVTDLEEEGTIDVTVTNLYVNIWAEKS